MVELSLLLKLYIFDVINMSLKLPAPIFLSNKIHLNLVNTFVMNRNKHNSKKTLFFPAKEVKI